MPYTMAEIIKWATDHGMTLEHILELAKKLPMITTNLQASRYLSAAGMMIVLYDTILTLPDEFRFIWPMSFGVIKAIWFLSRYVVPGLIVFYNYQFFQARPAMSDQFCQIYISALSWCLNISFAASNWLLLLRVSALWGRKRAVIWPLYFCYFALYAVISVIVGLAVSRMSKRLAYNPIINACMFTERIPANLIHSQWLPIVFDVVIFILTLVKAKQDNIALRKGSRGNAPVLFILFRDGGIYCVVIIALRIFNFVAWAFLDESMVYLAMGFLWAIVTTLINRFYLNLRRVAYATAAALLTNGSIRERPIAPGSGRLRELIEGAEMARRGAQSPWDYLDDDNMPVIDVVRQGDVDEMVMADLDRQRAQSVLGQSPNSPQSPQERWRSTTPHQPAIYEGHGIEEEMVVPPQRGVLIQQGITVTY